MNKNTAPRKNALTIYVWTGALCALSAIFLFSTEAFAYDNTARVFGPLNDYVRPLAHVGEYAVLFLILRWGLSLALGRRPGWLAVVLSFVLSVGYAVTDEWHQTFVPGRSGRASDVLLDATGALIGCLLWLVYASWRSKRVRAR